MPGYSGRRSQRAALLAASAVEIRIRPERLAHDPPDLPEVVRVEAPDRRRGRPDAKAGRHRRRALVEGHRVPVDGDAHLGEPLLGVLSRPLGGTQVDEKEMRVRAAGQHVEAAILQGLGEHVCIRADALLVFAERLRGRDQEARGLRGDDVVERPALHPGEHGAVDGLGVLLLAEDEPRARPGERLVRRRGDEVAVRHRARMDPCGDEPREVRHVAEQERSDVVRDLAEALRLHGSRIGRASAHDQLRPVLTREGEDVVVVDEVGIARDAVVDNSVEPPGEVDLETVREVTAVRELEREDRVARLETREVHRHVGLGAGVRLDIRVLGAEERLRAVDRELLDLVDDLAAAVVPPARVALRVLVRPHVADRFEQAPAR